MDEILNAAENYARRSKRPRLQRLIDELLLKADERDDADKAAKRLSVTLMTLHASKGLEFPRVFLVGLEEGILPHLKAAQEDTIEEERRLAYVGITRAQRALQMSFCLERARGGQRVTRHPSRFVLELAQREPLPAGSRRGRRRLRVREVVAAAGAVAGADALPRKWGPPHAWSGSGRAGSRPQERRRSSPRVPRR